MYARFVLRFSAYGLRLKAKLLVNRLRLRGPYRKSATVFGTAKAKYEPVNGVRFGCPYRQTVNGFGTLKPKDKQSEKVVIPLIFFVNASAD